MTRPRLLDLFSGAGGAGMGYQRAGFEVVGVDLAAQPHYPFEFVQADALALLGDASFLRQFDAIHASPPCQPYSPHVTSSDSQWVPTRGKAEPALIAEVRRLAEATGLPFVIENVYGARNELSPWATLLCGTMFGLPISRHRLFELSGPPLVAPVHPDCDGVAKRYAEERGWDYRDMTMTGKGRRAGTAGRWAEISGLDWPMRQKDMSEAIPPSYAEFVGRALLERLEAVEKSSKNR